LANNSPANSKDLQAEAESLGFSLFGITRPDPPPHFSGFESWLAAGNHGNMTYLSEERSRQLRSDPKKILPECRSILSLGIRYPSPSSFSIEPSGNNHGRVASYAWGMDYHLVIPARLENLTLKLQKIAGSPVKTVCITDSSPLLEHEYAWQAGLGWISKNTCLISPKIGSYFFLAEILTDVELAPTTPFSADRCGSCTRCIRACPTGCILPGRIIDARRCISYLTIENKGEIPHQLRPLVGNHVFGCDVCQEVCPWNCRFALPDGDQAFAPRAGIPFPDLRLELHLDEAGFNLKFQDNPVKRARRRGYLRNVAVAIGNQKVTEAIPDLVWALKNEAEPLIRGHVAWALGQIGNFDARRALAKANLYENDDSVIIEIERALQ
jgi:epoxyqueuosine reductase